MNNDHILSNDMELPIKMLGTFSVPGINFLNVIGRKLLARLDLMSEFAKTFASCTEADQWQSMLKNVLYSHRQLEHLLGETFLSLKLSWEFAFRRFIRIWVPSIQPKTCGTPYFMSNSAVVFIISSTVFGS